MILLGLGGNLAGVHAASPAVTLKCALEVLATRGIAVVMRSSWYLTRPVPDDGQPWYTNGVAVLQTDMPPDHLLGVLLEVERGFGRVRERKNAPRTVDLDLLAYDDLVRDARAEDDLTLPHPRMHERAFVLVPLVELAPGWRHPRLGRTAQELLAALQQHEPVRRLEG